MLGCVYWLADTAQCHKIGEQQYKKVNVRASDWQSLLATNNDWYELIYELRPSALFT